MAYLFPLLVPLFIMTVVGFLLHACELGINVDFLDL